jgi:hypothetical protein
VRQHCGAPVFGNVAPRLSDGPQRTDEQQHEGSEDPHEPDEERGLPPQLEPALSQLFKTHDGDTARMAIVTTTMASAAIAHPFTSPIVSSSMATSHALIGRATSRRVPHCSRVSPDLQAERGVQKSRWSWSRSCALLGRSLVQPECIKRCHARSTSSSRSPASTRARHVEQASHASSA